jgi:hypothetical protein
VNDGNAEAERWFTGTVSWDQDCESEHGGVYFAFIGGVSAFAGALQFGLQLGECGRRSFGEADQLARVPIDLRDLGGLSSESRAVPTAVADAG